MNALDIVTVITNQNINKQFKELAWLLSIYKTVYKVSYKPIVEATPMASILDQYEEESARATSISSVTPIQIPVSSNTLHSPHIEGTFTIEILKQTDVPRKLQSFSV